MAIDVNGKVYEVDKYPVITQYIMPFPVEWKIYRNVDIGDVPAVRAVVRADGYISYARRVGNGLMCDLYVACRATCDFGRHIPLQYDELVAYATRKYGEIPAHIRYHIDLVKYTYRRTCAAAMEEAIKDFEAMDALAAMNSES